MLSSVEDESSPMRHARASTYNMRGRDNDFEQHHPDTRTGRSREVMQGPRRMLFKGSLATLCLLIASLP